MRDLLRKIKPERLEDMTAVNALFRPGPLGSGMVDDYVKRKHGRQKVSYIHPKLAPVLEETYGVMAYQEQVMQISSALAGLQHEPGRRAPERHAQEGRRADGDAEGGLHRRLQGERDLEKVAVKVFDQMEFFSGYGFNKPHSACYAVLAVRTAYLKTHFAPEFMAATLTSEMDNSDRVVALTSECRRLGIRVLPPDVNEGHVEFRATSRGDIQFGLSRHQERGARRDQVDGRGETRARFLRGRLRPDQPRRPPARQPPRAGEPRRRRRARRPARAPGPAVRGLGAALGLGQRTQRDRDSGQTSLSWTSSTRTDGRELRPRRLPEAEPWADGVGARRGEGGPGHVRHGAPARALRDGTLHVRDRHHAPTSPRWWTTSPSGWAASSLTSRRRPTARVSRWPSSRSRTSPEASSWSCSRAYYAKKSEIMRRDAAVIVDGKVSTREDEEPKVIVADVVSLTHAHGRFVERMTISITSVGFEETMLEDLRDVLLSTRREMPSRHSREGRLRGGRHDIHRRHAGRALAGSWSSVSRRSWGRREWR